MVYNYKSTTFNELLEKDACVQRQRLQKLSVEMFKVSRGLNPEIIYQIFKFREKMTYELR